MLDALLTPAEAAARLGVPLRQFQRKVAGLRRDHGFPLPLPGMGGRYDPLAIDAWRRRQAGLDAPAATAGDDAELAAWQARLDARSGQIGRTGGVA